MPCIGSARRRRIRVARLVVRSHDFEYVTMTLVCYAPLHHHRFVDVKISRSQFDDAFLSKFGSCHIRYFGSLHSFTKVGAPRDHVRQRQWYNKICNTHNYISTSLSLQHLR